MKALIQRVCRASVTVDNECIASIDAGMLVLLAVERDDDESTVEKMAERLLNYRLFADADGRMNASLRDTGGGLLLVSQFTLAADTRKGLRPSFTPAAPPERAEALCEYMATVLRERHTPVACGRFAADMQVALVNDGPVTFLLEL